MGAMLSRRERELLTAVECQGDDIDVVALAADLDISQNTLKTRVKAIRGKLGAPAADYWLEQLPARARALGCMIAACEDEMPDDGSVRVDGTVPAL